MKILTLVSKFFKTSWGNLCRRCHYVMMAIPFIVVTASIVLSVASIVRINQILDHQTLQYAGELFSTSQMSFRKLTVLSQGLETDDGSAPRVCAKCLSKEQIEEIHEQLDLAEKAATGNTKDSGSKKGKGKTIKLENLWEDCYSSTAHYAAEGYIENDAQGSCSSCEIVGVSGAYDLIHPFIYESGGFISDNSDRYSIVLNTQMAWNLFHSYQIIGAYVLINGTYYRVVGVVCEGKDKIAETTGVTEPRAYVQFSQLVNLANNSEIPTNSEERDNAVKESDLAISCYEVLLTDPINNIAYNDLVKVLQDSIGYTPDSKTIQVINNTDRFNVLRLWKKYFPLNKSYESFDGMALPYHERSARLAERYIVFWAEMLVVAGILFIVGGTNIYAIFHGKETKHKIVEEEDEDESIPDIRRV